MSDSESPIEPEAEEEMLGEVPPEPTLALEEKEAAGKLFVEVTRGLAGGDLTLLKEYLARPNADVNLREPEFGFTLTHLAASLNAIEALKLLTEQGADLSARTWKAYGLFSLYWSASRTAYMIRSPVGATPLSEAKTYKHEQAIEFLKERVGALPPK
eukprot:m.45658 g.45658  ORF g.45658 m.45658 type:complete len:157 (+) comp11797_c0_seq1:201-671(+)